MKTRHLLILLTACVLGLTSCFNSGEPEYLYTNVYGIGAVQGTVIFPDPEGYAFNIVEDRTDKGWLALDRVFFHCDVLRVSESSGYDIRLLGYEPVTSGPALVKSTSDESVYGTNPVSFYQDWGINHKKRTLNLSAVYTALKKSDKVHTVDLVFDDVRSHKDTIFFELHHQGFGESYENKDYEATDFEIQTEYMTVDLSSCIPSDAGSTIIICVEWDWFRSIELNYMDRETIEHKYACGVLRLI